MDPENGVHKELQCKTNRQVNPNFVKDTQPDPISQVFVPRHNRWVTPYESESDSESEPVNICKLL